MHFGLYLVRSGEISAEDFVALVERHFRQRPPLGELAIAMRKLSMRQVFAILSAQVTSPKPFGEVAVDLGYLSRPDLCELLALQAERSRPFQELAIEAGMLDEATAQRCLHAYRAEKLGQAPAATHAATVDPFALADATH